MLPQPSYHFRIRSHLVVTALPGVVSFRLWLRYCRGRSAVHAGNGSEAGSEWKVKSAKQGGTGLQGAIKAPLWGLNAIPQQGKRVMIHHLHNSTNPSKPIGPTSSHDNPHWYLDWTVPSSRHLGLLSPASFPCGVEVDQSSFNCPTQAEKSVTGPRQYHTSAGTACQSMNCLWPQEVGGHALCPVTNWVPSHNQASLIVRSPLAHPAGRHRFSSGSARLCELL
jgi:hypothetical protein